MLLVLASASPRRKELLTRIGIDIEVRPADVDEAVLPGEPALPYVARMAASKADAVFETVHASGDDERFVLGADTIVEIDGDILGKPTDARQATLMLRRLVDRTHRVSTAFAIRGPDTVVDRVVTTDVSMRTADDDEIAEYVRAGEWRGKAGAYAVQGMAAALVREIRGSITTVIGLPLAEVTTEFIRLGVIRPRYTSGVSA